MSNSASQLSEDKLIEIENQIKDYQAQIKYDTKEYPVETIVDKYYNWLDTEESEIFVPIYQRAFTWDKKRQSKFIESVMLDIPIPLVFLADVSDWESDNDLARLEIVDWSQRIRTLSSFLHDELELIWLKKLDKLVGMKFSDLPLPRQRRFKRTPIRRVELRDVNIDTRRDIFERINTGSDELNAMEVRKWISSWEFYKFLVECSQNPLFKKLCPLSDRLKNREEDKEYLLRFFAYTEWFSKYKGKVRQFLDKFIMDNKKNDKKSERQKIFNDMLEFVDKTFPYWFKKSAKDDQVKSRVRFEAIAVWTALAMQDNSQLLVNNVDWINDDEFRKITRSDAANNPSNFYSRINFVKNKLLSSHIENNNGA